MSSSSPAAAQSAWQDLSVPAAALRILDVRVERGRGLAMSRAIRVLHTGPPSDTVALQKVELERLLLDLDRVEAQAAQVVSLPLPLGPDIWSKVVFDRPLSLRALFSAIIRDRQASLLYLGVQSMSPATLTYLTNHTDLLTYFYRDAAGPVGAFGGSFQVGLDGHVAIAGGPEAVELWEALVAETVARPERFARTLFGRDSGRLAYFFNAIAALDEPHRRFALGLWLRDRGARRERFRALYRAFVGVDPDWSISKQPFARPPHDPATLLALVAVDPHGSPAAPRFRKLWARAFDNAELPNRDERDLKEPGEDGDMDAAWLAEQLSVLRTPQRSVRVAQVAFGQRVFGRTPLAQLPDVLVALRGFTRFPAAMLALERMGIRDPALYGQMVRRAFSLQNLEDPSQSVSVLSQFQGACALLERLARTGAIRQDALDRLVSSLMALPVKDGSYRGQLVEWVESQLLPSLPPTTDADASLEGRILEALADRAGVSLPFQWEGESYSLDSVAVARQMKAVRTKQGGNSLDAVLAVSGRVRALAREPQRPDQLKVQVAALMSETRRLVAPRPWPDAPDSVARLEKIYQSLNDLATITKEKDLPQVERIIGPLVELLDYLTGETLVAIAYTPLLGDPAQILGPTADISHRHTFGVALARRTAWQRPRLGSNAVEGEALTGSLFGIDLALSGKRLRRLSVDRLPGPPRLTSTERSTYVETLALLNPRTLTDARRDGIGAALGRGRERLKTSLIDPAAVEALAAEARMSDGRRQLIAWTAAHEPEHLERLFSMAEVFWLGARTREDERWEDLSAWGMSHEPLSGCYCLRFPDAGSWDVLAGHEVTRQLASGVPDVNLRVAGTLSELTVPAALFPGVLALAIQDYVDTVPALFSDDWQAISGHAWQLTRERIEDYISAVVASGPIRPHTVVESPR